MKLKTKTITIKVVNPPSTLNMAKQYTSDQLDDMIQEVAAQQDTPPEYWIRFYDEGFSYCYDCAVKKVNELLAKDPHGRYALDGGFDAESDYFALCEVCEIPLYNSITGYCAEEYIQGSIEHGLNFASPYDCYCMSLALNCLDLDACFRFV